jgi:catechol 2,3-dioxygenase-like lactoylglutathione lyase family enzyme
MGKRLIADGIAREADRVRALRVHHVALWVEDLELMRRFYAGVLGGTCGPLYENERKGFRSYFVAFGDCRLELMWQAGRAPIERDRRPLGYAHVALAAGGHARVDQLVAELAAAGVRVVGEPRVTGDGYYEAVIEDPEGNRIEIVG